MTIFVKPHSKATCIVIYKQEKKCNNIYDSLKGKVLDLCALMRGRGKAIKSKFKYVATPF